jgi:hypothetical protein
MAFLMLCSIGSFASAAELALGKAQQGILSAGKTQSFTVSLNGGDYAQIKLEPSGTELVVITYDPLGSKFRGAKLGPDIGNVSFVAEQGGVYRLEIAASDKTKEAAFTITLEKVVTLAERLTHPRSGYESPRIKALKAAVENGKQASVDAFWNEVKDRGAPLIEPLAGDDKNMLVTFLWRGGSDTQNVFVVWFPYAAESPDDYHMARLGETDVWYKTVKVINERGSCIGLRRMFPGLTAPRMVPTTRYSQLSARRKESTR